MKELNFLISLTTQDSDFQREQASSAEETARRLGIKAQVLYAGNETITQSQQLLTAIQASSGRPDAIIFEPVGGTAMPQVAQAAAAAGIGWAVLNREADYVLQLRKTAKAPIFCITSNHEEIGRIQGRQFAALLPNGGSLLYVEGPGDNSAAVQRTSGMNETRPANIEMRALRGRWTELSAYQAVSSWMRLSTAHSMQIDVVGCQNDLMALGVRKAFQEIQDEQKREQRLKAPFTGCDGLPKGGQAWVRSGTLAATIVVPPNAGTAIEMMAHAIQNGSLPPERTFTVPVSYPPIESLAAKAQNKH
ncbi:MAG TPA: sugar ABC transporter substrate-binding protein [Terriglobales bacterium]